MVLGDDDRDPPLTAFLPGSQIVATLPATCRTGPAGPRSSPGHSQTPGSGTKGHFPRFGAGRRCPPGPDARFSRGNAS